MSDADQDVAVNVVNPSLSSRLSPPSPCANASGQTTPPSNESLCVSERIFPVPDKLSDTDYTSDVTNNASVSETNIDNEREPDDNDKQVSTDDTVINSASDNDLLHVSSSEESWTGSATKEIMGNQSGKKKKGSDDDTPDESKTKCCEIPKKKIKDRNSKISKSSRSEENDFDDDEVYPFDSRTRTSEQDDRDTVELEPFEIIETDDIKFIAGAGTSDVIRNVSESKFKAIPEEVCLDEDEELRRFEEDEEIILKETSVCIDKGDTILESGTTTAHSTFEFRQVKSNGKFKALREESQTVYEHVDMVVGGDSAKPKPVLSHETSHSSGSSKSKPVLSRETSHSSGSSKSNSSSSSKSSSRKNSKDAIPKPARNGKKKSKEIENVSYVNAEITESKIEKNEVKLSETPKSTNAVILTQTMFSKPKKEKDNSEVRKGSLDSQSQNMYENVNLCAIMTPTGIVIGHKKTDGAGVTGNVINAVETPKGDGLSASPAMHDKVTAEDKSLKFTHSNKPQIEPAIYETLNSSSLEDKPRHDNPDTDFTSEPLYSEPNNSRRALSKSPQEDNKSKINNPNVLQVEGLDDSVPPPSPQGMEILEEEEDEDDDEVNTEHGDRKSSEIVDFTENVCKRLSQLLETMPQDDEQTDDIADDKADTHNRSIHIYEEVLDRFEKKEDRKEADIDNETPEMISSIVKLDPPSEMHRNDSSNTLKRTSGDSNTYPMTEFLGSSDDDLPEYFDPRNDIECATSTTKTDKAPAVSRAVVRPKTSQRNDYVDMSYTGGKASSDSPKASSNSPTGRPRGSLKSLKLSQPASDPCTSRVTELQDITPTAEARQELSALPEYASVEEESSVYHTYGRHSVTYTESDLDISEHRDDLSTDSMLADDEDEETMEILFTKTYTEPQEGGEVFLSCTVVNTAYKEENKKSDTWLSDDALQYFEANAAEVMSTAFMRARKEMKDIQICIQNLRHQMEHFHGECDDVSLPDMPLDSLSPDYMPRKAVTD